MQKEIAVFGGTFDPPTLAHEAIIRHCLDDSRYDAVWVMPSAERTDKPGMHSETLRLALLHAMKRSLDPAGERLVISDFELQLPRPTETYDTCRALDQAYPATKFWFVYGADSLATMHTWRHGDYLRRHLAMLVVPRPGFTLPAESDRIRHLPQLDDFEAGLSSSEVRRRIVEARPYRGMVSSLIAEHIARDNLYLEAVQ